MTTSKHETTEGRCRRFADLGAAVYDAPIPDGLTDELPTLYGSLFSTATWISLFDEVAPSGACVLDNPRHVLLFHVKGTTLDVLNKAFPMRPEDARRACRALFRCFPRVCRIHLEVLFPPAELALPMRVLYSADDLVVELSGGADGYAASLGRRTRKNLRNYENRLRREHGEIVVEVFPVGDRALELVGQFLAWHLNRRHKQGAVSGYEERRELAQKVTKLLREMGIAQTTTIDGRLAAIEFAIFVGEEATLYAGSFDDRFDDVHLGFLSSFWMIREIAARGATRCHLLWSTDYYKQRLGGKPVRATRLSIFRTQADRALSPAEALWVARRRLARLGECDWKALRGARRLARAVAGLRSTTSLRQTPPGRTEEPARVAQRVACADLQAVVYPAHVPHGLVEELPDLYSSVFSTAAWWETQDHATPTGACVLENPRHVLVFRHQRDTVEILNKYFRIAPGDVERAAQAIFRAMPQVRRLQLEVMFPPKRLRLPKRVVSGADHMMIFLPATADEWLASLSRKSRGNLRNYENRLRRAHPDVATTIVPPGERSEELFSRFLSWKVQRYHDHQRVTFWEVLPQLIPAYRELFARIAEAHVTTIAGEEAAIRFVVPIGRALYALQGSFDPKYSHFRLGFLTQSWVVRYAIELGKREVDMLWSNEDDKAHLGAQRVRAFRVSLFPSHTARLHSLSEAKEVAWRRAREVGADTYDRGRHKLGVLARKWGLRPPAPGRLSTVSASTPASNANTNDVTTGDA